MKRKIIEQKEKLLVAEEEKRKLTALAETTPLVNTSLPELDALKQNYIELKTAFERQSSVLTQDYILRETHQSVLKDKETAFQARLDLLRLEMDADCQRQLNEKSHQFSQTLMQYTRQIQDLQTQLQPQPTLEKSTQSYSPSLAVTKPFTCRATPCESQEDSKLLALELSHSQSKITQLEALLQAKICQNRRLLQAATTVSSLKGELDSVIAQVKEFLRQWHAAVETQCFAVLERCQQWLLKKSNQMDKAWLARLRKLEQCIQDEDYLWIDEPGMEGIREGVRMLLQSKTQLTEQRDYFKAQVAARD